MTSLTALPVLDVDAVLSASEPYAALAAARDAGWIARSAIGLHVLTYDACFDLMRDGRFHQGTAQLLRDAGITDEVVRAQWLRALLGSPGAEHDRMRKLIAPYFTRRAISLLRDYVAELADRAVDAASDESIELVGELTGRLPPALFCRMIGAPEVDAPRIGELSATILEIFARDPLKAPAIESAVRELLDYVDQFIDQRRRAPRGDDLISALLAAEEDGDRLSPAEVRALTLEVLEASTDNTASQLALVMYAVATRPDEWRAIRNDPGRIPELVEEASRLWPRIMHAVRVSDSDEMFRDIVIPAGTVTLLAVPSAHRDPAAYEDPLRFDPGRETNRANLNYGSGSHFCLGASLARMEMIGAVEVLARRWEEIELAAEPRFRPSIGVMTVDSLPLNAHPVAAVNT